MKFGLTIAKDSIDFGILELDMVSTIATGVETVESNQMMGEYALGGGTGEFEIVPGEITSVIVEGAGTTAVNGTYTPSGTVNGKNRFIKGSYKIQYDGVNWEIFLDRFVGPDGYYYGIVSSEDDPPLLGWSVLSDGTAPAPTLTITRS